MKKIIVASLVALTMLSGLAAQTAVPAKIAGKQIKIAVVRNLGSDDNTTQFVSGAKEEGKALGVKVDVFLSEGDDAKFQDLVNQVIDQGYDGIVLSHGKDPYATALVKKIVAKGIPVSVFDTPVNEKIPGVTVTSQADESLADITLGTLIKDFNGKARIIKLWVAGFPPMDRRQVIYKKLLAANPGIKELESLGAVSSDVPGDTANKLNAILAKYPKGSIDAIWGSWDAFSQGAYKALKENGRTEIKLYSIDVSNQDLQLIQEKDSPWVLSAAVDPALIGRINLRLVLKKIAGETTPDTYEFKANIVRQSDLKSAKTAVNVLGLAAIVPGWGVSDDFNAPWFATLRAKNK